MNAVSYKIKRSTTSGSETTITTTTTTHYTDSPLQNGTTYYYEVSAVDSCGDESANSAEASVTPENAYAPVFTGGFISGNNIYANCDAGVGGSGNSFTFTVSGPPNSTWTIWSLPEGNYENDPQIIATITLDVNGNGSYNDPNAGTFDWSSQFYQLVSGDVASAIFGYSLVNIIEYDNEFGSYNYSPVQNPLVPTDPTVGAVIPNTDPYGGHRFWNSSDGNFFDVNGGAVFFDDNTFVWDYEWVDFNGVGWAYPYVVNNTNDGWISVNSLPYGYGDTYWFYGFPCDYYAFSDGNGGYNYEYYNYVMISFIGAIPLQ